MKKIVFILMSFSFVLVALSSCSCSTGEEYASRLYDVNVDMDGDGDAGDRGGEYNNVSFKGGVQGSCNISSHRCSGFVDDGNNNCAVCAAAGFTCHSVRHQ